MFADNTHCTFASFLLCGLLIRRITEPMKILSEAARDIAMGGFGRQVSYHRKDEVGELADAFNMMSQAVARYSSDFQRQAELLSNSNIRFFNFKWPAKLNVS